MGFWSSLKSVACTIGRIVVNGVITAAECTLEVCEEIARITADSCEWLREKIKKWPIPSPPKDIVHSSAKEADKPLIDESIKTVKEDFPDSIVSTVMNSNEKDRMNKIEELVPKAAQAMGIKNPPELVFFSPDSIEQMYSLYGGYNPQDNTLRINLPMIVSNEPELFQEQVCTIFHELMHARQYEAVMAWANGKPYNGYGYSEEYLQMMASNIVNYIGPGENFEAYTKQPIEAEAFWFEEQIKPYFK